MSSTLPTWKNKIISLLQTTVLLEGDDKVLRWLLPFAHLYIKGGQDMQAWPRQKLPQRVLLVNVIKEAMQKCGVPQQEMGHYVIELLQDDSVIRHSCQSSVLPSIASIQQAAGQIDPFRTRSVPTDSFPFASTRVSKRPSKRQTKLSSASGTLYGSISSDALTQLNCLDTPKFSTALPVRTPTLGNVSVNTRMAAAGADSVAYGSKSSSMPYQVDWIPNQLADGSNSSDMTSHISCIPDQVIAAVAERVDDGSNSSAYGSKSSSMPSQVDRIPNQLAVDSNSSNMTSHVSCIPDQMIAAVAERVDDGSTRPQMDCFPNMKSLSYPITTDFKTSFFEEMLSTSRSNKTNTNTSSDRYSTGSSISQSSRPKSGTGLTYEDNDPNWSDDSQNDSEAESKIVRRRRICLPKLEQHPDLGHLLESLDTFFYCSGKRSSTQLLLLKTTLQRILCHARNCEDLQSLTSLDYITDHALKTPALIVDYLNAYSSQSDVAATVRNEVNRLRDLVNWRSTLLLIGSSDDLTRRQLVVVETFLKGIQSRLQKLVTVKTPDELMQVGMWATLDQLRQVVAKELSIFKASEKNNDLQNALRFQQLVICALYTGCRPQRRSAIANLTLEDVKSSTITMKHFKTARTYGFLVWSIPENVFQVLQEFIQVYRPIIQGSSPSCQLLFLTKTGSKRQICSDVSNFFFEKLGLLINPTRIRQIYRTELHPFLSDKELATIDSADGHRPATVARHYLKVDKVNQANEADKMYVRTFGELQINSTE